MTKNLKFIVNVHASSEDELDMEYVLKEANKCVTSRSLWGLTSINPTKAKYIDKNKIIKELINKKAEENNTIDLDAYALGLTDAFNNIYNLKNEKT